MAAAVTMIPLDAGEQVMVHLPHIGGLPATVEDSTAETITVVLAVPDDRVRRLAGQEVAIERTTARGVSRYPGHLTVAGARDELLTVTVSGEVERVQRRNWARVGAALAVRVKPLDVGIDPFETVSVNVSVGGVLGRVVRDAGEDLKGIRIDDMGREDEERLMRFVRERERAELRMARGR
jgi:hypothetical protein